MFGCSFVFVIVVVVVAVNVIPCKLIRDCALETDDQLVKIWSCARIWIPTIFHGLVPKTKKNGHIKLRLVKNS